MPRPTSTFRPYIGDVDESLGVLDPDFLALGLGGTNMMSMLWTVAMGRRAVGVEMRGDPFLGVHWNIRVDLYHQLGLIDQMMMERFGPDGVPRRADGRSFRLAECFYSKDTVAGDIVADEIIDGYDAHQHIVGTIHHVEFIDDRWKDGLPHRVVTLLDAPKPPERPDPTAIRTDMVAVLDGPSTFQAGAASILVLLRRYLERIEQMDLDRAVTPRVRLFTRHRVIPAEGEGFIRTNDGRLRVRIEALQELDHKGKFVRVRTPGSAPIEIGVPELFMIAQGFHSDDAERLGFVQQDVRVDHGDGRGSVVAQADFLAGLVEVLVGGRLRRRISSVFDEDGKEYWARQIAVGHENDPEVGWVLVQVPDFKTFDPIEAGLLPPGTDEKSPEYFAAYQHLLYDFYLEQSAEILEVPKKDLKKAQMVYGPKMFSLVERMGEDARIGMNGVVAGDSFGNGHFLTSGGAMTGMVGHSAGVLRYWQCRDRGVQPEDAIVELAATIKQSTLAWLQVSAQEYSDAVPINFGLERIRQITAASGRDATARAHAIDASRRRRHTLLPLDPSDWRRLFLRNGRVMSAQLPELHPVHPALRTERRAKHTIPTRIAFVAPDTSLTTRHYIEAILRQPGARLGLIAPAMVELPTDLESRLTGRVVVSDPRDVHQIADAVRGLEPHLGRPDLLIGIEELLQVPMAEVRELLRITGIKASVTRQLADKEHVRKILTEAGIPLASAASRQRATLGSVACTLDVLTLGRVPAWFSSTRCSGRTIVLPRELDDPADVEVRQMGFAALRALGVRTGLATVHWSRPRKGAAVVHGVTVRPPNELMLALMGYAHEADMHEVWANAVVRGEFTKLTRHYAAGAVTIAAGRAVDRQLEAIRRQLTDYLVESDVVDASAGERLLMVRDRDTGVVEAALELAVAEIGQPLGSRRGTSV